MKISEIVSTEPEDKALAGLEVQKASLKLRQVQNKGKPKPIKTAQTQGLDSLASTIATNRQAEG